MDDCTVMSLWGLCMRSRDFWSDPSLFMSHEGQMQESSHQQPGLHLAPLHRSTWQPKGAADVGVGGCHCNLNRQSRNEFHHQRLTSKLNSASLTEKHSDGKCQSLRHAPESCPCPLCLSDISFLSPTEPNNGFIQFFGWIEAKRRWCVAGASPKQGTKLQCRPPSAKASHKIESQIHHKFITLFTQRQQCWHTQGDGQSPTLIPRAQTHLGVQSAPKNKHFMVSVCRVRHYLPIFWHQKIPLSVCQSILLPLSSKAVLARCTKWPELASKVIFLRESLQYWMNQKSTSKCQVEVSKLGMERKIQATVNYWNALVRSAGKCKHRHLCLGYGLCCHRGVPSMGSCKGTMGLQEGHTSSSDNVWDHSSPDSPWGRQQRGNSEEPGWFWWKSASLSSFEIIWKICQNRPVLLKFLSANKCVFNRRNVSAQKLWPDSQRSSLLNVLLSSQSIEYESALARKIKAQFLNLCCQSSDLVPLEVNLQHLAKTSMCNKTSAHHWNPCTSLIRSSEKMAGGFPSASVYSKTLMKSVDVPRQFSHIHDCFSTH